MGGKSTQTSQSYQQSKTQPWEQTIPSLTNIIGGLNQSAGQYQPSAIENQAISQLQANAASIPNFTDQGVGLLNSLFGGGTDRTGIVNDAYSQYQQQLTPYAQGQYLDPRSAPGMSDVLDTIRNDVGNSVNSLFAGAGRDLSGAHTQALARGISQGEAVPLLNQYNQNVSNQLGAAGNLFGAGGTTAGLLSGLDQTALQNQLSGLQSAPLVSNADAGTNASLQAEQIRRGLPLSNLGQVLNLLLPIAGLGSQSSGSGTNTTQNQMSGAQQFATIAGGLGSLGGKSGGLGAVGTGLNFLGGLFSDRRLKEDIEQVGQLYDGTPVYRFRYLDSPTVHIGLMADEVEQFAPEAVMEVGGYKMVDYLAATERAMGAR